MEVADLENPTSRSSSQKSSRRSGSRRSQKSAGQQSSPTVFPEKKGKSKSSRQKHLVFDNKDSKKAKNNEQKNDVVDEKSNFSGYEIYSGKLFFDKKNRITGDQISANGKADTSDVRLTSKALIWGSSLLSLEDVISVSFTDQDTTIILLLFGPLGLTIYLWWFVYMLAGILQFWCPTFHCACIPF